MLIAKSQAEMLALHHFAAQTDDRNSGNKKQKTQRSVKHSHGKCMRFARVKYEFYASLSFCCYKYLLSKTPDILLKRGGGTIKSCKFLNIFPILSELIFIKFNVIPIRRSSKFRCIERHVPYHGIAAFCTEQAKSEILSPTMTEITINFVFMFYLKCIKSAFFIRPKWTTVGT
jgi:hypothetical protein